MTWIRIRKWDKWQTYRKDRGQPPWIKVHREVMRNPDWVALTDAQRGQLVAMWLLAADRDGVIPASPSLIKKLCYLDSEPDLQVFVRHGFIEADANVTSEWRQHDVPEAEVEAEKEEETDTSKPIPVSDMWEAWLEILGGDGRKPKLTAKRRQALKLLYLEHLKNEDHPIATFRRVLKAVLNSDHHMGTRSYQFPESLFRNEERRDRWVTAAMNGNGASNGKDHWSEMIA